MSIEKDDTIKELKRQLLEAKEGRQVLNVEKSEIEMTARQLIARLQSTLQQFLNQSELDQFKRSYNIPAVFQNTARALPEQLWSRIEHYQKNNSLRVKIDKLLKNEAFYFNEKLLIQVETELTNIFNRDQSAWA